MGHEYTLGLYYPLQPTKCTVNAIHKIERYRTIRIIHTLVQDCQMVPSGPRLEKDT